MQCLILLAIAAGLVNDQPELAMVKLGGCSGVCVSETGIVLTAKHCGTPERQLIFFEDGPSVMATLLVVGQGIDSCIAYDCDGDGFPYLPVSETLPAIGDPVHSYGYPGPKRELVHLTGKVLGGVEVMAVRGSYRCNNTTLACRSGHSGGPLLSATHQICGVLSTSDMQSDSQFISWAETQRVYQAALKLADGTVVKYTRRKVIAFVSDDCPPCTRLKFDVLAGRFAQFDIEFVTYSVKTSSWDKPELVAEMFASANPTDLGFPLLWVQGTASYRVGYDPDRRGGLIGWLGGVFDGLGKLIIGERPVTQFPDPNPDGMQPTPDPVGSADPQTPPQITIALASVEQLKRDLLDAKADLEKLKSANPLEKLRGAVALKSDIADIKTSAATALAEVRATKDDAKEKPLQYLWGLIGILSGLAHRRFAA